MSTVRVPFRCVLPSVSRSIFDGKIPRFLRADFFTDPRFSGQLTDVSAMSLRIASPEPLAPATALTPRAMDSSGAGLAVVRLYNAYADFVFRSLRRLGVDAASLPDALQEVFIVVHRRLDES